MKILVTGGAGFLGSHLCDRLIKEGNAVICIDNCFTGKKENIEPLLQSPRFQFIHHDIVEPFQFEVDQVYNLACPASPLHYQHDPIKTTQTSILGALNCLELARSVKARVLQASTSEIYGDPQIHPQPETYWGNVHITGPRACYDEGKRCAETLFFDYYRCYQVPIRVVRIFNTYGPCMHAQDGRVVSSFITKALRNEPLTVYGLGTQTRSFCYVDDLVEGLVLAMNHPHFTGPTNLGNPQEIEVVQLAKKIIDMAQSRSSIIYEPLPEDDPKRRQPCIQVAREQLGWQPKVSLEHGLQKTIDYFKNCL